MKKIIITIILSFITLAAFAASPAVELNQMLGNFTSMQANFNQTVNSSDGVPMQTSNGKLKILRPGMFYWKQIKPMAQIITTNGKTLWIYEPDLKQVTMRSLGNSLAQTPLLLLTNKNTALQSQFTVKRIKVKAKGDWFELTPKEKGQSFKNIFISFVNNQINSLSLINALGDQTIIKFTQVKMNQTLNPDQFTFIIPKGVDVVKQ
jgi:outer membrane lipoprotein carrier protein